MKRALLGLSAALFAASMALAWVIWRSGTVRELAPPPEVPPAAVSALFAATLPDAGGTPQRLAQWRGRILVVNYWATWCTPCRDEMPEFSRLQTRYAARGVQFVGIAIDDAAKVREFAHAHSVAYPLLVADQAFAETARALGNGPLAVPYTVVFDGAGTLRAAVLGRVHADALAQLLDRLVL